MKLRHLPKFAIVAIAIGALLVVSGSAFAAYQLLWPKPEVHVSQPTTSVSGRQEVAISFASCGASDLASHYELKSNATITIDEVPNVVKAHCELDAISTWADKTFPHDAHFSPYRDEQEYDSTMLNTSMATHIKSSDGSSILFAGLTKYNQVDQSFTVTSKTRFIANGMDVSAKDITSDDSIVYITSEVNHFTKDADCNPQHCSQSGRPVSNELLAVVKLSQPFQYYDQFAWQSLTERTTCEGNPDDTCLSGFSGAIDLYENNIVPEIGKTQMKEIQGVVTELNGNTTVIRSSSGTLFTIVNATDIVSAYNTQKAAQYYNNLTVKVGSSLRVSYIEAPTLHTRTLASAMLMGVQLQTEQVGKSDLPSAY